MAALKGGKRRKDCNKCKRIRRHIGELGEHSTRARRAANGKLRKDLDKWADKKLPDVKLGKINAKRDTINNIIVSKQTCSQVFTKNVRGEHLIEVLEMLRHYKEWMPQMTSPKQESAKHHKDAVFNVYEVKYNGRTYTAKTKVEREQEILFAIRRKEKGTH